MGHLENLNRQDEPDNHGSIKSQFHEVRRQISVEWERHCTKERALHGSQIEGDDFDQLLWFLLVRGVL